MFSLDVLLITAVKMTAEGAAETIAAAALPSWEVP